MSFADLTGDSLVDARSGIFNARIRPPIGRVPYVVKQTEVAYSIVGLVPVFMIRHQAGRDGAIDCKPNCAVRLDLFPFARAMERENDVALGVERTERPSAPPSAGKHEAAISLDADVAGLQR